MDLDLTKSVSSYFDLNDTNFQTDSNILEVMPSKRTKFGENRVSDNVKMDQCAKKGVHALQPKISTSGNSIVNHVHESQPLLLNKDTQKQMDLNEVLQEISQGWQEVISQCVQSFNDMENYEEDCLKYLKELAHHTEVLLQNRTAQKEMICKRLEMITDALKSKP
uniref:Uncharacterized protein n=1 Tax=Biomphalaria glabrata TaxID=6526 RepID=A0A2C9LRH8_BIOGL